MASNGLAWDAAPPAEVPADGWSGIPEAVGDWAAYPGGYQDAYPDPAAPMVAPTAAPMYAGGPSSPEQPQAWAESEQQLRQPPYMQQGWTNGQGPQGNQQAYPQGPVPGAPGHPAPGHPAPGAPSPAAAEGGFGGEEEPARWWVPAQRSAAVIGIAAMAAVGAGGATASAAYADERPSRAGVSVGDHAATAPVHDAAQEQAVAQRMAGNAAAAADGSRSARVQSARVEAAAAAEAKRRAREAAAQAGAAEAPQTASSAAADGAAGGAGSAAAPAVESAEAGGGAPADAGQAASAAGTAGADLGTVLAPLEELRPLGAGDSYWSQLRTGQDFAASPGAVVRAVADGRVTSAGWAGAHGYRVVQTLGDGTEVWYCHLAAVAACGSVTAGQAIGRVGATGAVRQSRLHLEVRPAGGDPQDPVSWLAARGVTL